MLNPGSISGWGKGGVPRAPPRPNPRYLLLPPRGPSRRPPLRLRPRSSARLRAVHGGPRLRLTVHALTHPFRPRPEPRRPPTPGRRGGGGALIDQGRRRYRGPSLQGGVYYNKYRDPPRRRAVVVRGPPATRSSGRDGRRGTRRRRRWGPEPHRGRSQGPVHSGSSRAAGSLDPRPRVPTLRAAVEFPRDPGPPRTARPGSPGPPSGRGQQPAPHPPHAPGPSGRRRRF